MGVEGSAERELDLSSRESDADGAARGSDTLSVPSRAQGISSLAVPAAKPWDAADRPNAWQDRVYGLVVHTTGSSIPADARAHGVYHTVEAVDHYSRSHGCHYINGWRGVDGGDLV
jgi:hypothetical protein